MKQRRPGRAALQDRKRRDTGNVVIPDLPHARQHFAHAMMIEEFARLGHLRDDQWAWFRDLSPKALARRRAQVRTEVSPWS